MGATLDQMEQYRRPTSKGTRLLVEEAALAGVAGFFLLGTVKVMGESVDVPGPR